MEVLSINVIHNIWLLMELIAIEVLNSNTYIIIILKLEKNQRGKERASWCYLKLRQQIYKTTYRSLCIFLHGICKSWKPSMDGRISSRWKSVIRHRFLGWIATQSIYKKWWVSIKNASK
jgi:hypothetical protein